jgi:HD-GYP domain-containing protein (c-di-GMP phosphodiesterase class II)
LSSSQSRKKGGISNLTLISSSDATPEAKLLAVSKDLSTNTQVDQIMTMILDRAVEYTTADAGSIFLVEQVAQESFGGARPSFRYELKFHKTKAKPPHGLSEPIGSVEINTKSIVGFAACTGQSVRVRDCYVIPSDAPYKFNNDIDKRNGYRTKSILTIPIKTNANAVIGVLQLINKTRPFRRQSDDDGRRAFEKDTIAFSENDEKLIEAFASHAAVALENAKLTGEIARLFESFVTASVSAIEARDPSTSGHSERVARLTCGFAEKIDGISSGPLSEIHFNPVQLREIRYASLLHDFGKIGVRENVLLKAKKLFPHELETILLRLDALRAKHESAKWRESVERMAHQADNGQLKNASAEVGKTLWTIDTFNRDLDEIRRQVIVASESQILDKDLDIKKLMTWLEEMSQKLGQVIITPQEAKRLSLSRGTLSMEERREIESHVSYTYEFLRQIAWTEDLAHVPEIAHGHHEKLDGTGYPRGLKAEDIPIQARMMAISDIFDALTAMDRPYKKAVPHDRALDILHQEADQGKLDKILLRVFVESEVYKVVSAVNNERKKAS